MMFHFADLTSTATTTEVDYLLRLLKESKTLKRTPVAGVFMTSALQAPLSSLSVLVHSMAALPKTIILLHISFCCVRPFVDEHERYDLHCHSEDLGVYSLNMYFGYCEPFGEWRKQCFLRILVRGIRPKQENTIFSTIF